MLAIAKAQGFYAGKRIREGEFFEVADGAKGTWFEIVGGSEDKPAKSKPKAAAPKQPDTFSELNKETAAAEAQALAGKVEAEQA